MIKKIKNLFTYPKYKLIKERDQNLNTRYAAIYQESFFLTLYLYWGDENKTFVLKDIFGKYFPSYQEAADVILARKKYEETISYTEKEIVKKITKNQTPIFKKVLTIKY